MTTKRQILLSFVCCLPMRSGLPPRRFAPVRQPLDGLHEATRQEVPVRSVAQRDQRLASQAKRHLEFVFGGSGEFRQVAPHPVHADGVERGETCEVIAGVCPESLTRPLSRGPFAMRAVRNGGLVPKTDRGWQCEAPSPAICRACRGSDMRQWWQSRGHIVDSTVQHCTASPVLFMEWHWHTRKRRWRSTCPAR